VLRILYGVHWRSRDNRLHCGIYPTNDLHSTYVPIFPLCQQYQFIIVNMGSAVDVVAKEIQPGDVKSNDEGIQSRTGSMAEGSAISIEEMTERTQTSIWVTLWAYKPVLFWSIFICLAALMWGYDSLVSCLETQESCFECSIVYRFQFQSYQSPPSVENSDTPSKANTSSV